MPTWNHEVHRGIGALTDLAQWWDSQPSATEIPYVTTRALQCWAYGFVEPQDRIDIRVLVRDGDPVAAIPLFRRRQRFRSFSTDQVGPCDLPVVPDEEVIGRVPTWLNTLPVAHLYRLREESVPVQAMGGQPRWLVRKRWESPFLDLTGGIESARSKMSSKSQSTLRRRWRKLEGLGEVTFVDHPKPVEVDEILEAGLRLEAAGWKGTHGKAVLTKPTYERYYRSLAEVAQEQGWLRLSSLHLDDDLVAFQYDLVYGNRRYLMLTTYDESPHLTKLSIGNLMLDAVIEQSCADSISSYEFGYGRTEQKDRWTDKTHLQYDISIYGNGPVGRALGAVQKMRAREKS